MDEVGKQLPQFLYNLYLLCIIHILKLKVQDLLENLALPIEIEKQEEGNEDVQEYDPNILDSHTAVTKLIQFSMK